MQQSPSRETVNKFEFENHVFADNARLDRIEAKIDKMSEVVIQMAKAEEKLVSLENDKKFLLERILKHDEEIARLSREAEANKNTLASVTKLLWTVITAVVTAAAGFIVTLMK